MKKILPIVVATLCLFISCNKQDKAIDKAYYKQADTDFEEVKKLSVHRNDALFTVFEQNLNDEEIRYLKFLYAYMPLSDIADLDGAFFLAQVRTALEARGQFSWGKTIPDDIFRHFVLPYRVNNEYPDTARQVFYRELKPRIENLSMNDAALEVNHWCHEKVNYRGTDDRTISPLDAVRSGFGRCGEESTFAVTALRSVGIPARQVYTPRWAHCDDNHAWVEVWVDGKWYFMGACEPDSKLNRGWFEGPAKRAMLVHTRVFGKYTETGNQMITKKKYSVINVIDTYIKPVQYVVLVKDPSGVVIENAEVRFGLYNYAEFYPIASLNTNAKGLCSLNTNHGTLLVSATKDNRMAYDDFRVNEGKSADTLLLILAPFTPAAFEENIDIIVPVESATAKHNTEDDARNQCRVKEEDSLRNAYAATFPDDKLIFVFAETRDLNSMDIGEHIKMSCGNYSEIMDFIDKAAAIDKDKCLDMLNILNEKDHRDARSNILLDHFNHSTNNGYSNDIYLNYVLNPRISTEKMKAYRSYLQTQFSTGFADSCLSNPGLVADMVKKQIAIDDEWNYYGVAITPVGVHSMKIADKRSRNIYFVAVCRSFGIAARLNPVTYIPEYYLGSRWQEVLFDAPGETGGEKSASLVLKSENKALKYYADFTIAQYENGKFTTLDYGWDTPLSELSMPLQLRPGYYMLMSGKRMQNGDVLVWRKFFSVEAGKTLSVDIIVRNEINNNKVIGKITNFSKIAGAKQADYYLTVWIDTGKEPGKHILQELADNRNSFVNAPIAINLQCVNSYKSDANIGKYSLPTTCTFTQISPNPDFSIIALDKLATKSELPVVALCNAKGEILYYQSGYKVGMANQILNLVSGK